MTRFHARWIAGALGLALASTVVSAANDIYYSLLDRGFFEAYDVTTGDKIYEHRLRVGSSFTSSPWAYNGKIFALSEQGDTYIIRAGREFEIMGVNSLGGMAMASPAIAGDRLLIRTQSKVYSIKKP